MSTLVVVLGMHRSGTSCLTRALHTAGLYLGTDLFDEGSPDNLEGHWESREAWRINERILSLSGGSWHKPPETVQADDLVREHIRSFLASLRARAIAGWKDPRTTLTFPIWEPELGNHRIVAVFRHPLAVARSLQIRDGMPIEQGLALWSCYNQRLLTYLEKDVSWPLIDFDVAPETILASLRGVCGGLGLCFDAAPGQVFNHYLRHQCSEKTVADANLRSLYQRLRDRAYRPAAQTFARVENPANMEHFAKAQTLHDQCLQRLRREISALRTQVTANKVDHAQLRGELDRMRQEIQAGQARLQELHERQFYERTKHYLRQSRLLRRLASWVRCAMGV